MACTVGREHQWAFWADDCGPGLQVGDWCWIEMKSGSTCTLLLQACGIADPACLTLHALPDFLVDGPLDAHLMGVLTYGATT